MKRSRTISASQGTQLVRSGTTQSNASKRSRSNPSKRSSFGSQASKYTGFGFPPKLNVKHRYIETNALSAIAGSYQTFLFRCNGMYDPNYSGTGHQPMYFDQVSAIYDHFTVTDSYLKLTLSTTSAEPQNVVVYVNDDTTVTPSNINGCMEQASAKSIIITANAGPRTLFLSWNAYKTFGGSVLGNDNLQGSAGADPTEQSLYTIVAQAVDITKATSVLFNAEIVYKAVWDEVKDLTSS